MATQIDRLGGAKGALAYKAPCRVATTANITLSGTQTIDGVALVIGDRVLVKNQDTATENGIWVVASSIWTRATDFDGNTDAVLGTRVDVTGGAVGYGEYKLATANPVYIGTSSITWSKETPVVGPGSAVDANLASYSGTGGSLLQDSGIASASVLTTANIASTGTNGVQQYVAASTDVLTVADLGVSTSAQPVQKYVGSTATVLTTSQILSTSAPGVEPSHALPSSLLGTTIGYSGSGGLFVNSDNGVFQHLYNNNNGSTGLYFLAPSNNGNMVIECINTATPGTIGTSNYHIVTGTYSTGANATSVAFITRTENMYIIEWKTTL